MARVTNVEDELDEAADEVSDEPDEDEDETEDETDDELEDDEDGAEAYDKLATRLTKRVDTQIAAYVGKQAERLEKYRKARQAWRQRRLDEYALAHLGSAAISNPAAVEESINRQVKAAEDRLAALQAQRSKLAQLVAQGSDSDEEIAS